MQLDMHYIGLSKGRLSVKKLFRIMAFVLAVLFLAAVGLDMFLNEGAKSIKFYVAALGVAIFFLHYAVTHKRG